VRRGRGCAGAARPPPRASRLRGADRWRPVRSRPMRRRAGSEFRRDAGRSHRPPCSRPGAWPPRARRMNAGWSHRTRSKLCPVRLSARSMRSSVRYPIPCSHLAGACFPCACSFKRIEDASMPRARRSGVGGKSPSGRRTDMCRRHLTSAGGRAAMTMTIRSLERSHAQGKPARRVAAGMGGYRTDELMERKTAAPERA